ncbi:hypothetical protein H5410_047875 [Solanum commersonii]|uniref:Uncharacterized protein n=1 Tax=Solanum commersonii TaxID=4109 RepID=A0A9J5XGF1_SOLCO|nr:hypothetical protein H5410_047875 [Solanum commersonii]
MDNSLVVYVESLEGTPTIPTLSHPTLNQEVMLWMGNLSYSIAERASRFKAQVPTMIKRAIETALVPLWKEIQEA